MKLTTSRFGEIEVDESKVIHFTEGLPGFQGCTTFILIDHNPDSPFKWLQSTNDGNIAFVVIDPVFVVPDYTPEISDTDLDDIKIDAVEKAALLCIVNISRDGTRVTVNLLGPIVINPEEKCGKQAISLNPFYTTKHDLTSACQDRQKSASA